MTDDDRMERYLELLAESRDSSPSAWNEQLVIDALGDPAAAKAAAEHCQVCHRPCEDDEVCATMVAGEAGLTDGVDPEVAIGFVEAGMERLEIRDEVRVRTEDETRPNTFVRSSDS